MLTAPPTTRGAEHEDISLFQRILCPIDFSAGSVAALEYALALARDADGKLAVMHVLDWLPEEDALLREDLRAEQHRSQQEADVRARLQAAIPAATDRTNVSEVIAAGKPSSEILRQAEHMRADVIVMGVGGRGTAGALIFGSTSNRVLRAAQCPVLTLRTP